MSVRSSARWIATLFIIASAAAIAGGMLAAPAEDLAAAEIADRQGQIVTGVLLELLLVAAVVGIAALFFPILRRQDEGLAVGYVAARTIEAVLLLVAALGAFVVAMVATDGGGASLDTLIAIRQGAYLVGSMLALGAGALILYWLLFRSGIVPAWLSVWGLAGAVLIIVRAIVEMYGIELSAPLQGLLAAPIAINEMVLAVWLIVRGFDEAALDRLRRDPANGPLAHTRTP